MVLAADAPDGGVSISVTEQMEYSSPACYVSLPPLGMVVVIITNLAGMKLSVT